MQNVCVFNMFLKFGSGGSAESDVLKQTSRNVRDGVYEMSVVLNDG